LCYSNYVIFAVATRPLQVERLVKFQIFDAAWLLSQLLHTY
jgi:hypothetical protein